MDISFVQLEMQIWKQLKNTLTNKDSLTSPTLKGYGFSAINYKSKICKSKNYVLLHLREDLWNYKKEHMKNVIKKLLNI